MASNNGNKLPFRSFPIPELPMIKSLDMFPPIDSKQVHHDDSRSMFSTNMMQDAHLEKVLARYHDEVSPRKTNYKLFSGAQTARVSGTNKKKKKKKNATSENPRTFDEISDKIDAVIKSRNEIVDKYIGKDVRDNGNPIRGEMNQNKYLFFRVWINNSVMAVKIDIENLSGRTETFVSTSTEYFLKTDKQQTHWKVNKSLMITGQDLHWKAGCYYYISVFALSNCTFMLRIQSTKKHATRAQLEKQNHATHDTLGRSSEGSTGRSNIRKRVLERLKVLKESPIAMTEFQRNINEIQYQMRLKNLRKLNMTKHNQRNFELENIMLQQIPYDEKVKRKKDSQKKHNEHVFQVVKRKHIQMNKRQNELTTRIQLREFQHQRKIQEQRKKEERAFKEHFCSSWLTLIKTTNAGLNFSQKASELMYLMKLDKLKSWAIIRIQRWVRRHLSRRREKEAQQHMQMFRAYINMCAFNLNAVKYERSANIILWLLEKNVNVNPLSRKVRNYTRKVKTLQRVIRRWKTTKTAKVDMWRTQWTRTVNALVLQSKLPSAAKKIPQHLREEILHEHMERLTAQQKASMPAYFLAHQSYLKKYSEEARKRKVMGDRSAVKLMKPSKPHVPPVLQPLAMKQLIHQAVKMVSEASALAMTPISPNGKKSHSYRQGRNLKKK